MLFRSKEKGFANQKLIEEKANKIHPDIIYRLHKPQFGCYKMPIGQLIHPNKWNPSNPHALAVPQSMLQGWLRDKHNIHICICVDDLNWNYQLYDCSSDGRMEDDNTLSASWAGYVTYEDALEAGLLRTLSLI